MQLAPREYVLQSPPSAGEWGQFEDPNPRFVKADLSQLVGLSAHDRPHTTPSAAGTHDKRASVAANAARGTNIDAVVFMCVLFRSPRGVAVLQPYARTDLCSYE